MHAFFAELATLGFVSLLAFIVEREWDSNGSWLDQIGYDLNLGHTLHYTFENLHFLLFGISVCFVILSMILLRVNLAQFKVMILHTNVSCKIVNLMLFDTCVLVSNVDGEHLHFVQVDVLVLFLFLNFME